MEQQLVATVSHLTTDSPTALIRAALTRADQLGIPTYKTIAILRTLHRDDINTLLDDTAKIKRLVTKTRANRTRSVSSSGRAAARVRAARQLLARVLGGEYTWSERAVLAVLGLRLIDTGWPTVQVGYPAVAVELGLSERQVHTIVKRLVEKRAISVHRKTPGHAHVYRVLPLTDENERAGLSHLYDAVGALANGERHPVADAVHDVGSPRWGYSDFTHRHWAGTVAVAAAFPMPASSQVHRKTVRELRQDYDAEAAAEQKAAAVEAAAVRAAERIETVEAARETWRASRAWVEQVESSAGPAYKALTPQDRHAWLGVARAGVQSVPESDRAGLGRYLANHLRKARWGTTTANKAAGAVVR